MHLPTDLKQVSQHTDAASASTVAVDIATASTPISTTGRTINCAELAAASALGIPAKFVRDKVSRAADGFSSMNREATMMPDAASPAMTTSAGTGGPLTLPTGTSHPWEKIQGELPEMPYWAVGIMAGLLAFGVVATVMLVLVNFPGLLPERNKMRRDGYRAVDGAMDSRDDRSPAYSTAATESSAGLRHRRKRKLSVDTSIQYVGLGIAVHGDKDRSPERRNSYDEEALRARRSPPPRSAAGAAWSAVTAPIPSVRIFSPSHGHDPHHPIPATAAVDGRVDMDSALESGTVSRSSSYTDMLEADRNLLAHERPDVRPHSAGFLERLNDGMDYAAGKLARMMHDQVALDHEEGLLLPVRMSQRERADSPMMAG
jgi:hypothetical protein